MVNFGCVLSDWGTANDEFYYHFFGGTPVYAGPRSFEDSYKDLFSFCRLALELLVGGQGKSRITAKFELDNQGAFYIEDQYLL